MKSALITAISLLFLGCFNEKAMIQKFAPKDDDEFARHFTDLIRQARYEEADPMLDPAVAAQAGARALVNSTGLSIMETQLLSTSSERTLVF